MITRTVRINKRYIVHDLLGQGGMGAVYRATDRLNGQVIALKQVTTLSDQLADTPSTDNDFRIALSDEFRTLASLRHPNIIGVLDYGFEGKQPYFTMELLESPRTILTAGKDASINMQIRLLVELLQALVYLHRRGVLHRDLKPGNILVAQDGTVKVLDFGLSLAGAYSRSNVQESTAGTLAYMAPELFSEEHASVASDLYAMGVIACELLTGHYPFNQKNVALLLNSIISSPPDLSGLDGELADIVACLLAKQPGDRYDNAADVIRDLCHAIGQPSPIESNTIRESFLQAAKFVGRQEELQQLRSALDEIVKAQETEVARAWLIGGESGVGKSRLLDELRIRALVRGTLVLRGQAITEGSIPYQIWRDPLRRLILSVDLEDDDAAVLKNLIPDIESLLERPLPEAPALDPQMSQNRFIWVVSDVFRSLQQPTVVILEDLQWANDENLELLQRLIPLTVDRPLLLIASYRDDERPELRETLAKMQHLKLTRLDRVSMSELSESMLGDAGRHPEIIALLQQETEGNVFFVVEVVRALAEHFGQLDRINQSILPTNLLTIGIQNVVQSRLNRVPENARPLLRLAALAGRELDLDLLRTFTPNLDRWLEECNIIGVIEVEQNHWRFAHDKLREGILSAIEPNDLPDLHRQLAETLEHVHPNDSAHIPAIARHYQHAEIYDKAAHYLTHAADLAKAAYVNTEAIALCLSALNAIDRLLEVNSTLTVWHELCFQLYEMLGDLHNFAGKQDEARDWFQKGFSQTGNLNSIRRARIYRKWANTWVSQRRPDQALPIFANAESVLNDITDTRQIDWWTEWIDLHLDLMWANYWLNRAQVMDELAEKIRPRIDQFGIPLQRSRFLRSLVLMEFRQSLTTELPNETLVHAQISLAASRESGNLLETNYAQFTLGLAYVFRLEWDRAEPELQRSLNLSEQIGAAEYRILSLTCLTVTYCQLGQEDLVARFAEMSMTAATEANMTTYIAVAKANQSWLAWREGDLAEAQKLGTSAIEVWREFPIPFPMQWLAYWPLIGVTNKFGDFPLEYIKALFAPGQRIPPKPLTSLLRSTIDSHEQGDDTLAQTRLDEVVELARQLNYL